MSRLSLADRAAAPAIAAFVRRVVRLDPDALVRVVARDRRAGVYAVTPFDVLALFPVALREPATLDVVLEAGTLGARSASSEAGEVDLPAAVPALRWTTPLPPWSGWRAEGRHPLGELTGLVDREVREFRERADALTPEQRTTAALEALATEIWNRPVVSDVPGRLAHAARSYGFLPAAQDLAETVGVFSAGPWRRLDTPGGSIVARVGLSLSVSPVSPVASAARPGAPGR